MLLIIWAESLSKFKNNPLIICDICLEGTGIICNISLAALNSGFKYHSSSFQFRESFHDNYGHKPLDNFSVICVYLTICWDLTLRTWAITPFKYPHYCDPLSIMSECLPWPTLTHYPTIVKTCPFLKRPPFTTYALVIRLFSTHPPPKMP